MNTFISSTLNIPAGELNDALQRSASVITGSCILTVLDATIPFNDVDIVVPQTNKEIVRSVLEKYGQFMAENKHLLEYEQEEGLVGIDHYKVNGVIVQLLFVEADAKTYVANFDFDVAQNYWDGQAMHIAAPESIQNNQVSVHRGESCVEHAMYRVEKYRQKGFIVSDEQVLKLMDLSVVNEKKLLRPVGKLARVRGFYSHRLKEIRFQQKQKDNPIKPSPSQLLTN
jgi:hypothetical protein